MASINIVPWRAAQPNPVGGGIASGRDDGISIQRRLGLNSISGNSSNLSGIYSIVDYTTMLRMIVALLFVLAVPFMARAAESGEAQKIQYLIQSIANLKDAKFVRNGTEYGGDQAADHLRLKLKNAGERIKTAEQFIEYCATKSSQSGQAYTIRYSDGRVVESAVFLRARLSEYKPDQ
jgi:Family of unknown function (DUF5329)